MWSRRVLLTTFLLISLMCGMKASHEVTCEVGNIFDAGEGKVITFCEFSKAVEISDPSTVLLNPVNHNVTKILLIDNSNVEYMPKNISLSFPNLEVLEIGNCSIKSITNRNFIGLTAVKRIYLQVNKLQSLNENTFNDLVNLVVLYLGNNSITSLPSKLFSRLEKLENLYLFNNQLTTIDVDIFENNKNLEFLDLSSNKLESLPSGIFNSLSLVRFLYLDYNEFRCLSPHIFDNCASLERIYLAGNKITQIDQNLFFQLKSLRMVSFECNPLLLIDFAVFDNNKNLTKIDVRDIGTRSVLNIDKIKEMTNLELVLFLRGGCVNNDYDEKSLDQLIEDVKANCSVTADAEQ